MHSKRSAESKEEPSKTYGKPKGIWVKFGPAKSKFYPIEEFEKLCQFKWTEDVTSLPIIADNVYFPYDIIHELADDELKSVEERMKNPGIYTDKILLRHEDCINFYPVASEDIQKNEFLGLFAGEFKSHLTPEESEYAISIPGGYVTALKTGNVGRFHASLLKPHDVTPERLINIKIPDSVVPASQNIEVKFFKHHGAIKAGLFASNPIPKNCPMGWSYSPGKYQILLDRYSGNPIMKVEIDTSKGIFVKAEDSPKAKISIEHKESNSTRIPDSSDLNGVKVSTIGLQTGSPIYAQQTRIQTPAAQHLLADDELIKIFDSTCVIL